MPGPKNNPPPDVPAPKPAAKPTPITGPTTHPPDAQGHTGDPGHDYLIDLGKEQAAKRAGTFKDSSGLTGVSAAAAQYPAFASLMAIPEVAQLLNQASVEGWSNDQFTLHLMTTNWWKSQSDTERVWEATKLSDPAKAAQQKNQMFAQVATEAHLLGVPMDTNQLNFITEAAVGQGWNSTQIQQALAGNAQFGHGTGTISAMQTSLRGIASNFGVPLSGQTTFDWAKKVARGTTDQASFTDYVKDQAKLAHPYWQKQLDQGMTVRQLADPYIQNAAKLLDINPNTVDLSDPKWNSFTTADKTGAQTLMSQQDWTKKLITDPHYGYASSTQGLTDGYDLVNALKQGMGAR